MLSHEITYVVMLPLVVRPPKCFSVDGFNGVYMLNFMRRPAMGGIFKNWSADGLVGYSTSLCSGFLQVPHEHV